MKRLVMAAAACLAVAAGTLFYVSTRVSEDAVLRATAEKVATLTGNWVEIRGATTVSFLPFPVFELNDVVLTRREGDEADEIAAIDVLRGSVALLPLLIGHVELKDFVLVRPRVRLAVDRRGRGNWSAGRRRAAEDDTEPPPVEDQHLGSFRIEDGAIAYANERTGARHALTAVNATISWSRLAAPLNATGTLIWNGENVRFGLGAEAPLDFVNNGSSQARISVESGVANVAFDGNAHNKPDPQLEGTARLQAPSVRGLLRWIGTDLGTGPGLNAVSLAGRINLIGNSLSLSELVLSLDNNEAEGGVKITLGGKQTGIQGTLAFETLDLGVYRTPPEEGAPTVPQPEQAMSTVVDLSALQRFGADLRVSAASVTYGDLTLGRTAGTVTVRKGAIDLGVGEATLYGGMAQGSISATPTPDGARIKVALKLDKTDIGQLLTALSGSSRISGTTTARVDLSGTGRTVAGIVASLSGNATLAISPGAIQGIDIEKLLAALETGRVEGWPATSAATDLDDLTASFTVSEGTATTEDFRVTGPKIAVSADGEVRLVSASIAGHGTADLGAASESAINGSAGIFSVPFVIEGPIANPTLYPDPVWLLNRPTAAPEEIEQLRKDLQQSQPEDVVEDLVQRGRDMPPKPAPSEEQPMAPRQ